MPKHLATPEPKRILAVGRLTPLETRVLVTQPRILPTRRRETVWALILTTPRKRWVTSPALGQGTEPVTLASLTPVRPVDLRPSILREA